MAEAQAPAPPEKTRYLMDGSNAAFPRPAENLGGTTVDVASVAALQAKLIASADTTCALTTAGAHRGNTYRVPAGSSHSGVLTLPVTTGTGWTCIRSNGNLPNGTAGTAANRVGPSHAAQMFKIVSLGQDDGGGGAGPSHAMQFPVGAHGYRIIGVEATHPSAQNEYGLVNVKSQRVIIERSYLHAHPDQNFLGRALYAEGGTQDLQVWDSWLQAQSVAGTSDDQGIFCSQTVRVHVENNEIRAAAENMLLGDQATLAPAPCLDTTVLRNHFYKPETWRRFLADGVTANPTWDGRLWNIKNSFEIKNATKALVEGNWAENCWKGAQDTMLIFNGGRTGSNPWVGTDVLIQYNLWENAYNWLTITMAVTGGQGHRRIAIVNNFGKRIDNRWGYFGSYADDVRVEHNTVVPTGIVGSSPHVTYFETTLSPTATRWPNVTVKRNIVGRSQYGITVLPGDGAGIPTLATWDTILPSRVVAENAEFGSGGGAYPGGITRFADAAAAGVNTTTGVLASNSPLKAGQANGGSDGLDLGVNHGELANRMAGVPSVPNSTFSVAQPADGLLVNFTNTSSGGPNFTAHAWTLFATNGTTVLSTATTPNHSFTYPASGSYNVRHQVSNGVGPGLIVNQAIQVNPIASQPTIAITGPTGAATLATSSPTITLSGTSTNAAAVSWSNDRSGGGVATGLTPWSTPPITLFEGVNVLTATATNQDLTALDTLTVTFTPPPPIPGAPPIPQALGAGVSGVGAVSVAWPVHQTNDVALLVVETANEGVATPAGGWGIVLNAPQGLGTPGAVAATRVSVFWKRAAGFAEANAELTDSGDHQVAQIHTVRGCNPTGNPWDVTAGDTLTPASGTITYPAVTTTVPNTLLFLLYATDIVAPTLSLDGSGIALTSPTLRLAIETALGNGGALVAWTGVKATAGATGGLVTTQTNPGLQARMTIALRGVPIGSGAPTIALTTPAGPTHPASSTPLTVTGTATDDVGVTGVTWTNAATGASGPAEVVGTTSATWSVTLALQSGLNDLAFTVHDNTAVTATVPLAVTYTPPGPVTPAPPDLMRGFGVVRGAAANDAILTPLTAHAVERLFCYWARREETALPRSHFTKSTQAIQVHRESVVAGVDGSVATLHYKRQWSGGTADWYVPVPTPGTRFHVAISYSTSAPANVPTIWIDHVVQPLATIRQPAGGETILDNAAGYLLGNFPSGLGNLGGDLAKWTIYNRLGTQQDVDAHYAGDNPMTIGVAPVAYHVLDGAVATEPDAVTSTVSVVTGTLPKDYAPVIPDPPTVSLAVTSGSPAANIHYQVTATVVGAAHRVEFYKDTVPPTLEELVSTDLTAPYTMFPVPTLLGPGAHALIAKVYAASTGPADDTAQIIVTEPSVATGTWTIERELCDRVPNADSYNHYINGDVQSIPQPATGNPKATFTISGADTEATHEVSSVTAAVESARMAVRVRYTDPSATPVEGITEISRAYNAGTTTWTITVRNERKKHALEYEYFLDSSSVGTQVQPAGIVRPTFVMTFTGASVEKTIGVRAVFAGGPGPQGVIKRSYVAIPTSAPTGGQELSREFTA